MDGWLGRCRLAIASHDAARVILVERSGSPTRSTLCAAMSMISRCSDGSIVRTAPSPAARRKVEGDRARDRVLAAAVEDDRQSSRHRMRRARRLRTVASSPSLPRSSSDADVRRKQLQRTVAELAELETQGRHPASSISISAAVSARPRKTPRPLKTIVCLPASPRNACVDRARDVDFRGSRPHRRCPPVTAASTAACSASVTVRLRVAAKAISPPPAPTRQGRARPSVLSGSSVMPNECFGHPSLPSNSDDLAGFARLRDDDYRARPRRQRRMEIIRSA